MLRDSLEKDRPARTVSDSIKRGVVNFLNYQPDMVKEKKDVTKLLQKIVKVRNIYVVFK